MANAKGPPTLIPDAKCLAIAQRNQLDSPLLRMPAEMRNKIYAYTLDLTTGGRFHASNYDWDRLSFVRSSRQIFAETAAIYFELKLLPHHSNTPLIKWIPNISELGFGFVLPLTPSQFRMVDAIAMDWYKAAERTRYQGHCPFEPMEVKHLVITGGPKDPWELTAKFNLTAHLKKWMKNPSLENSFDENHAFEVMGWV